MFRRTSLIYYSSFLDSQMDKLASSDVLIMELYTENAQLLQALHLQNLSQSTASGLSM